VVRCVTVFACVSSSSSSGVQSGRGGGSADDGGGEGAASADPDEDVTESDLFGEDDEEGAGWRRAQQPSNAYPACARRPSKSPGIVNHASRV
jgi:hypothetical protein